jgi:hypothetical protein
LLRLKFGPYEAKKMNVILDASVSAVVKNALVEGDWVEVVSSNEAAGQPLGAGGVELRVVPVTTTASRLSYPIGCNPQQPDNTVPGVGITVYADGVRIGYTDRFDPALGAPAYADVPLVAKSFTVSGVTRYGLVPASGGEIAALVPVAWGIGIFNNELCFRAL